MTVSPPGTEAICFGGAVAQSDSTAPQNRGATSGVRSLGAANTECLRYIRAPEVAQVNFPDRGKLRRDFNSPSWTHIEFPEITSKFRPDT